MIEKDFIDNIDVFLHASPDSLAKISYLYLANCNLQQHCSNPNFLKNLALAQGLTSLNLSHNNIGVTDLALDTFIELARELPKLFTVNLRNTLFNNNDLALIDQLLNVDETRKVIVIGAGSSSHPVDFIMPGSWGIPINYSALELEEVLRLAKFKYHSKPLLQKFHAYRNAKLKPKTNVQTALQNQQTNMPFSIIMLNGAAYLIPKLTDKQPAKIAEYNSRESPGSNLDRRIKLAIYLHDQQLKVCILKICALKLSVVYLNDEINTAETALILEEAITEQIRILEGEHRCLLRTNNNSATLTRTYDTRATNHSKIKHYLTMDFYPGIDLFELLEAQYIKLNTSYNVSSKVTRLDLKLAAQNMSLALTALLGAAITHSRGIIHCDLKPENLIMQDRYLSVPIDYGLALSSVDSLIIKQFKGTADYLAPELRSMEAKLYTFSQDCYSMGLVLRQILYPIVYIDAQVGPMFTSDSRNEKLQHPNPEYYLKPHFHNGIAHNYGSSVADVLKGLTEANPQNRTSLISAFCKLAVVSPQLAQKAFDAQMRDVVTRIKYTLRKYPKINIIIAEFTPKFNILITAFIVSNPETQTAAINALFCLNTVCYFLKLADLCNGELPEQTTAVLQRALTELFSRHQLSIEQSAGLYYHNPTLEEKIKFHHQLKLQILNDFVNRAQDLISKQNLDADNPIILQLLSLQSSFVEMWDEGKTLSALIEVIRGLVTSEDIELSIRQWLCINFAAIICPISTSNAAMECKRARLSA